MLLLENLMEFYRKSDGKTKKKILGCIFAEKPVFEKMKARRGETEKGRGGERKSLNMGARKKR